MDTYAAVEIDDFWTVLDVTSGQDLRAVHRFSTKDEAEQMADIMNGRMSGELAGA